MLTENRILIIGGDNRQCHLCDLLLNDGYACLYENNDILRVFAKLNKCRYIVLPVPVTSNGRHIYSKNEKFRLELNKLFTSLSKNHIVFGGGFPSEASEVLNKRNIVYADMNNNEDFLIYNAYLTAQGAVRLLLSSTQRLITGKKILVTGFGRISKALVLLLRSLGAYVTVCARSTRQLTEAECMGYETLELKDMSKKIYTYDFIFNTVPDNIFTFSDIAAIDSGAIYFELASKPYGAPVSVFEELDKKLIDGASLPGRYLSESAGERIAEFIRKMV